MTHLTGFPCSLVRRGSRRGAACHKQAATPRAVKGNRPSVARGGSPRAIKWVIINEPWYDGMPGGDG